MGCRGRAGRWFFVCLLAAADAEAARPLDTEDTGTVAAGHAELELGTSYARDASADAGALGAVLSAGVAPRIEARVEAGVRAADDGTAPTVAGLGDALVGAKGVVVRESLAAPAVLAGFTLRLPTGDADRGLGAEGFDPGALLAVSRVLGDFQLTGNGGYTLVTDDRSLDFWTASAALEWAAAKGTILAGELVGNVGADEADDVALVRFGLVHEWSMSLKLDAAIAAVLKEASPDVVLSFGVTLALY